MVRFGVVVLAFVSACYHPSYRDCDIACSEPAACPSGLTCDMNMHRCTSGAACTTSDASDAMPDVDTSCWPMAVTNFDPCNAATFPAAMESIDTTNMPSYMIDTNDPTCSYAFGAETYCLRHVVSMHVASGFPITVVGSNPLIIVSDNDIVTEDTITASAIAAPRSNSCTARPGPAENSAGGGAGGGMRLAGGDGGASGTGNKTPGGTAIGTAMLSPLVPGCPGADGGVGGATAGGVGGYGGGAVQLDSKTSIGIEATVIVAGGGGRPGALGASSRMSGGGGGGAGGAILLEAPMIGVSPAGKLCAPGGGGGQGGLATGAAVAGMTSTTCTAAPGGTGGSCGPGGFGSIDAATPGGAGGAGQSNTCAGGGGGGAPGRIHLHASSTPTLNGVVLPAPQ
ncbi:MAG: hypothetical protein JO257_13855 [Deltaproteobacteria bacterium]|nr:hypothetical protein [Deltaproteobacteria bacterium]